MDFLLTLWAMIAVMFSGFAVVSWMDGDGDTALDLFFFGALFPISAPALSLSFLGYGVYLLHKKYFAPDPIPPPDPVPHFVDHNHITWNIPHHHNIGIPSNPKVKWPKKLYKEGTVGHIYGEDDV